MTGRRALRAVSTRVPNSLCGWQRRTCHAGIHVANGAKWIVEAVGFDAFVECLRAPFYA